MVVRIKIEPEIGRFVGYSRPLDSRVLLAQRLFHPGVLVAKFRAVANGALLKCPQMN